MVCIYCGGKTQVTNSRPQKRLNHTWRRRECVKCHAVFTTEESTNLGSSVVVRWPDGTVRPFSRDKMFASILRAVGHRPSAIEDASALTATVIAHIVHSNAKATLEPTDIVQTATDVLQRFDNAAGVQYRAYHRD